MKKSLFLLFFVLFVSPTASGQSPTDNTVLKMRIDKIDQELRMLQRSSDQGSRSNSATSLSPDQIKLIADMSIRLEKLEAELRSVTGELEELSHQTAMLDKNFNLFRQDLQMQLQNMESITNTNSGDAESSNNTLMDDQNKITQSSMVPATPAMSVAQEPIPSLPQASVEEQYDFALSYLRKGDYFIAEKLFQQLLTLYPKHTIASNAQYWLGETFYARQNYPEAAKAFLSGFQKFPQGSKGADSLLKLGLSLAAMGQVEEACNAYAELKERYPNISKEIAARITIELQHCSS